MTKNLILGLDLDGTLADHTEIKLNLAKMFGLDLMPHQTASEIIRNMVPEEIYEEFQHKLYTTLSHHSLKMSFAEITLAELKRRGWNFVIISKRKKDGHISAREWLKKHLSKFIPEDKIFFVEKDEHKNIICRQENVLAFIDDQTDVLGYLDASILKILIDPFGNWNENLPQDLICVKSWREIPLLLSKLEY